MKKLLSLLVFALLGTTAAVAGSHRIVRIHRSQVHVIKRHVPVIRPVVVQRTIRPVIIKRIQPKPIVKRVRYTQPTVVTRVYRGRPVIIGPALACGIIGAAVGGMII